jgi:two-component system, chemotaxis family, chemotaxis protein CheY
MMPPPRSAPDPPLVIVLVDDAEDCLAMLDVALQTLPGVVIRSARSAEDALKVLASGRISAVVTDIQLPAMTGLELISRIRRQPGLQAIPIVVVSAAADPATPQAALASGANAFFPKPFSPAAVRRKLEELMYA